MRLALACTVLAAILFAGCSGEPNGAGVAEPSYTVAPTATTGIIRGLVVDEAIRPVAGARVTLLDGSVTRNTQSADDGGFGFEDLVPGTYFLTVARPGFLSMQTSSDVVAGEAEPPIVRVLLARDVQAVPSFQIFPWEGFIQCSARFVVNAVAACSAVPGSEDNFTYRYSPAELPAFAQSEMLWKSTQALGNGMKLQYTDDSDGLDNFAVSVGPSPLMVRANGTVLESKAIMDDVGLYVRIFAGSVEGTRPPQCVPSQPCEGVSVVINQAFTVYTVFFYGFEPTDEYRFSTDGEPKVPDPV